MKEGALTTRKEVVRPILQSQPAPAAGHRGGEDATSAECHGESDQLEEEAITDVGVGGEQQLIPLPSLKGSILISTIQSYE